MRVILLPILLVLLFCNLSMSQNDQDKMLTKVQTIDSTIETLYSVISGEKGEERNWGLFLYLFTDDAQLIPTRIDSEGNISLKNLSPQDYINTSGKWLVENGFHEIEIHRVTEQFGPIAHLFSTYESYRSKKDKKPFMRGINSIQMVNDGTRWYIVNIYWSQENPTNPIPKKYLPAKS